MALNTGGDVPDLLSEAADILYVPTFSHPSYSWNNLNVKLLLELLQLGAEQQNVQVTKPTFLID